MPYAVAEDLWGKDHQVLSDELDATTEILNRFARAVADAASDEGGADDFLHQLDLKLISEDHNWRAIFATIRHQKVWSAARRQAVLERYLQYLGFRRRLLAFIMDRRANLSDTGSWLFSHQWALEAGDIDANAAAAAEDFVRLPQGEPVTFDLGRGRMLAVWFADRRFLLVASQPPSLVTDTGVQLYFPRHRNLFGRHPSADVPVPGDYVNVSRAHALLEWTTPLRLTITDLSANGILVRGDDHRAMVV